MGEGGDSLGFTWFHLVLLGFAWFHFVSLGFTWFHLVSLGLTWFHLVALGFTWFPFVPLGLTWFHLDSLGLTWSPIWSHLVLLQGKRESCPPPKGKRENPTDDVSGAFPPYNQTARTHERNETISRLVSLPPTSDIYIYIYTIDI